MQDTTAREGEPSPNIPPPSPPVPPSSPLPPIPLDTIWDVAKIVIFVVVWYITNDANKALCAHTDYAKIATDSQTLIGVTWHGASIGLLQGLIMSAQALAIIWASPTLFLYLGPVLSAALKTPIKLVAEFRRAMNPKSSDGDGNKPDDSEKKKKNTGDNPDGGTAD